MNFNNMIVSVARSLHWTPKIIDKLYIDNIDHHGLEFWYEDVKKVNDEVNSKYKK